MGPVSGAVVSITSSMISNAARSSSWSADLILHSLYACILDIVRLESTHESIKAFGKRLKQSSIVLLLDLQCLKKRARMMC